MTSSAADRTEPSEAVIRYAEGDDDVIAIHRFLMVVAQPQMLAVPDARKSINEVWRVCKDEVGLMLIKDGILIGTMGLIRCDWWYAADSFMTERWHFVLPDYVNTPEAAMLLDEARALADAAGLPFIHQGKIRAGSNGYRQMMPRLYRTESAKG